MPIIRALFLAFATMFSALPCSAQTLPAPVVAEHPGLSAHGEGVMRFFGFKVYDVRLWTMKKPFAPGEPFALELVYDMAFNGRDIAGRSVQEMRGQGQRDETKLKRWGEAMTRIFPDIKKGDTLIGVSIPGKEARFYTREKLIATVPDPEFAQAFFDIWLSEKTSAPTVRNKLLAIP